MVSEKKSELVSILIPAYNSNRYISETITSILTQTYRFFELLISDDASTDNTFEIIKSFSAVDFRIKIYRQPSNIGFVANKNFLLSKASGAFIAWQDSDDISMHDRIEKQLNVAKIGYHIVATDLALIGSKQSYKSEGFLVTDIVIKPPIENYPFMFATMLFSRQVFERNGFFDSYFTGALGEDFYWTMKANNEFPIYFLNEPLYQYRIHDTSSTNSYGIKKLIIPRILQELLKQNNLTGRDWLANKDLDSLDQFENQLLSDRVYMSEQYRIWAAKYTDLKNFSYAWKFLMISIFKNPGNKNWYRTFFYLIRKSLNVI